MADTHVNRLRCTVSAVASSGLGAFTIGTASSGYRTFGASQDGQTFTVVVTEGAAWEVNTGCTYTHSGTTLARGTLADSSTGSAITFTTAAVITEVASAAFGNKTEAALQAVIPGGRLTLESGVPVPTADQTAKTSIYYTPHLHNIVNLWDGANWVPTTFTEKTLALGTLTSAKPYDVFGYLSSGQLVLELLAWTSDTARATAVTLQDGRYCKSGDKTRLLLGSFYTTSTTTTEDSGGGSTTQVGGKRFIWNTYNQVLRSARVIDTANNWTYTTGTIRRANAGTGDQNTVQFLYGAAAQSITAELKVTVNLKSNSARSAKAGIGYDSDAGFNGITQCGYISITTSSFDVAAGASLKIEPAEGKHTLSWIESGADGTCIFSGDGAADGRQSGLDVMVMV